MHVFFNAELLPVLCIQEVRGWGCWDLPSLSHWSQRMIH